jgi:prepilin-type N-terminal cleavage/methylation domain-containing protein
MSARRTPGFTLVEVLVAVVLTGLVAVLAHQLFGAVIDGSGRLERARRSLDRAGNARGLLRDAFLSLDVGSDGAGGFDGQPQRVAFTTWLPTADGWDERHAVELGLAQGRRWTATGIGPAPIVLADSIRAVAFDYLLEPGADARWVGDWHSPVSAPIAVRVRITDVTGACDTMLYLIKGRG